ncbi:hypothetical protein [Intestinimonas butyriciproducens]|uniref:hypothetical protein n=1 Tax=Intestinimonas butyriciproducens TaxID=1297617 RepID=UPI001956D22A|nr:hypothetical protein [Intestinimonas butyriciproducens]MBM6919450.1 hypothetical protein [Intestinimonas butyriciproducens]
MNSIKLKRLAALLLAAGMVLTLVGCNKDDAGTDDKGTDSSQTGEKDTGVDNENNDENDDEGNITTLTEEEYKAKITEIGNKVGELTEDVTAAQSQATEDPQGALTSLTETVNQMRPLYDELANLAAPENFADAQAKIKEGAEASVEILDLTLEMMELASNPDTIEEAQTKMTELTEKMTSYSDQASKLTEGLTEVLGS